MDIILNRNRCELKTAGAEKPVCGVTTLTRQHLRCFKGAKLAVFVALLLGSNDEGWAETNIPQLERATGYTKHTVESALSGLCRLEVSGRRLLLVVPERERAELPHKLHCRIFPSEADIRRYETKCRCRATSAENDIHLA